MMDPLLDHALALTLRILTLLSSEGQSQEDLAVSAADANVDADAADADNSTSGRPEKKRHNRAERRKKGTKGASGGAWEISEGEAYNIFDHLLTVVTEECGATHAALIRPSYSCSSAVRLQFLVPCLGTAPGR